MNKAYDIIKSILRTEKGTDLEAMGKYVFAVERRANKIEITKAVELVYNVKVKSVNTTLVPGKLKRVRQDYGYTSDWKKAVVTLKEGQKIEVK